MAAILSLNGAKYNPKIVTKITAVRSGVGGSHKPLPLNTPLHLPASISLCIKLESNFINRMIESLTLGSKGQRSQQYKLGEHAMRCLSDLQTIQARSQNFSLVYYKF